MLHVHHILKGRQNVESLSSMSLKWKDKKKKERRVECASVPIAFNTRTRLYPRTSNSCKYGLIEKIENWVEYFV